jgi:hypothetical protein
MLPLVCGWDEVSAQRAEKQISPQGWVSLTLPCLLAQTGASLARLAFFFWAVPHSSAMRLPKAAPRSTPSNSLEKRGFVSAGKAVMRWLLALAMVLLSPWPLAVAPVAVRFAEGPTHGFLLLRTVDGTIVASGDLMQVGRGGKVESRRVFRFKDGSLFDETVVFTQQRVFAMESYHLVQRGPAFAEDTEISLQRASGKY